MGAGRSAADAQRPGEAWAPHADPTGLLLPPPPACGASCPAASHRVMPGPELLGTGHAMELRQAWMHPDLMDEGAAPLRFVASASPSEPATVLARRMRAALDLASGWAGPQRTWSDAVRALLERLEGIGVLATVNDRGRQQHAPSAQARGVPWLRAGGRVCAIYLRQTAPTRRPRGCLPSRMNSRTSSSARARRSTFARWSLRRIAWSASATESRPSSSFQSVRCARCGPASRAPLRHLSRLRRGSRAVRWSEPAARWTST